MNMENRLEMPLGGPGLGGLGGGMLMCKQACTCLEGQLGLCRGGRVGRGKEAGEGFKEGEAGALDLEG